MTFTQPQNRDLDKKKFHFNIERNRALFCHFVNADLHESDFSNFNLIQDFVFVFGIFHSNAYGCIKNSTLLGFNF